MPSSWDLTDPEFEPASLASPVLIGGFFTASTIWEAYFELNTIADKTQRLCVSSKNEAV